GRVAPGHAQRRHIGGARRAARAEREHRPALAPRRLDRLLEQRPGHGRDVVAEHPQAARQELERGVGDESGVRHGRTLLRPFRRPPAGCQPDAGGRNGPIWLTPPRPGPTLARMKRTEAGGLPEARQEPQASGDPIDRRRFLVMLGGAAVLAAAGSRTAAAKKGAGRPHAPPSTIPAEPPASQVEAARALIGAAILAPSDWNTQPWSFEVDGAAMRLVADTRRALPVTDPERRGMMIALGAALENLLVAARAYGLRPAVTYFPHSGANGVVAEVTWSEGETQRDLGMSAAIP